jgi:hypothetical protein
MARWDMANFFDLTDRRFTACRDMDNMRWIYESIQGYKNIFGGFELDMSKYVNSGFMIFNEEHKDLLNKFIKPEFTYLDISNSNPPNIFL